MSTASKTFSITPLQAENLACGWLGKAGLVPRVSLCNKSDVAKDVFFSVHAEDGTPLVDTLRIGHVEPGGFSHHDVAHLFRRHDVAIQEDRMVQFSLVPTHWPCERESHVTTSFEEITRLTGAHDHYVEYVFAGEQDGFCDGVLYQTGLMNCKAVSPHGSLLFQAPKILLTEEVSTAVLLLYPTFEPDAAEATVKFRLFRPDGSLVIGDQFAIQPRGLKWLDLREAAKNTGWRPPGDESAGFHYLEMWCEDASFVSVTFLINNARKTFALEHTLYPNYYFPEFSRGDRAAALTAL